MNPKKLPRINADWLHNENLQHLFDILEIDGEEMRVNGGAVRNSILGEAVRDVDLATTLLPNQVSDLLVEAGVKAVPTGIAHGTVTAVINNQAFEITTLRQDIETDGRHAVVHYGRDWEADANRRDLTMNALYCSRKGEIFDPLDGYGDVVDRNVRFIGEADQRISEDYLRILRFFRFFAQYGSGRPDGEGLKACARLKNGLEQLSVERVWQELKKIFAASDPTKAILWMRTTGVLSIALPESEKWGIDFFPDLILAEQDLGWPIDPMLRLKAIVPPQAEKMEGLAQRLRFSTAERKDITNWAGSELPNRDISEVELGKFLYRQDVEGVAGRIMCEITRLRYRAREDDAELANAEKYSTLLKLTQNWQRPVFPIRGKDFQKLGIEAGPKIGEILAVKEKHWVESSFQMTRQDLLKLD